MLTKLFELLMSMQGSILLSAKAIYGRSLAISAAAKHGSKANASPACCPQVSFGRMFPLPHTLMQPLWQD